jgi:hypothetical protein
VTGNKITKGIPESYDRYWFLPIHLWNALQAVARDCSLHVYWHNLQPDAEQALDDWKKVGFTRVILYIEEPFPIREITGLAELMNL